MQCNAFSFHVELLKTLYLLAKLGFYKLINTQNNLHDILVEGCYGKMMIKSPAKDTPARHWEMAGIILKKSFPV